MFRSVLTIIVVAGLVCFVTIPALAQSPRQVNLNLSVGTTGLGLETFHNSTKVETSSSTGGVVSLGLSTDLGASLFGGVAYQHTFGSNGVWGLNSYEFQIFAETYHNVSTNSEAKPQIGLGVALGHLILSDDMAYEDFSMQYWISDIHGKGTTVRLYGLASVYFFRSTRLQLKAGYAFGTIAVDDLDFTEFGGDENGDFTRSYTSNIDGAYATLGFSVSL